MMQITEFVAIVDQIQVRFNRLDWTQLPTKGLVYVNPNMGIYVADDHGIESLRDQIAYTLPTEFGFVQRVNPNQMPTVFRNETHGFIMRDSDWIFRISLRTGEWDWLCPTAKTNTPQYQRSAYGQYTPPEQVPIYQAPGSVFGHLQNAIYASILTGKYQPTNLCREGIVATVRFDASAYMVLVNRARPNVVDVFRASDDVQVELDMALLQKLYDVIVLGTQPRRSSESSTSNSEDTLKTAIDEEVPQQLDYLEKVINNPINYGITFIGQADANSQVATVKYAESKGLTVIVNRLGARNRLFVKLGDGRWVVVGKKNRDNPLTLRWVGINQEQLARISILSNLPILQEIYNATVI